MIHTQYAIQTQLARITETIESLKKGAYLVQLRFDTDEESIRKDNLNHANELVWGWEQLLKDIRILPESCIDKSFYTDIAERGLKKAAKLLTKVQDQYFEERENEPYPLDLTIGLENRWLE